MTSSSGNRYDKLNELGDVESDARVLTDEWIQAPDGSWVRSTDKVARKIARKTKRKSDPEPETEPAPQAARATEPAPPAEPKRKFGRLFGADQQRKAELELQRQVEVERERKAELERQAELRLKAERERQAELDRQAERERQAELDRLAELDRKAELARKRQAEQERKAELEREWKIELERRAEVERQGELERERKAERERALLAELEREVEVERERQAELAGRSQYYSESDRLLERWPDIKGEQPAEPERKYLSDARPKPEREPRRRVAAHGRFDVGQRVIGVSTAVAMVVATLLIGAAVNWLGPDPARSQRPFTNSGEPGESLDIRTFTITVQTARAAAAVQSGPSAQDTQGAWVIVRVRLTANSEPARVGYVALRDRAGRTYLATDRIRQPLLDGTRTFQPGIPIEGEVVFEVPKDSLAGLTALFAAQPDLFTLDAMASVELPELSVAADQPPATLAPAEVRP